MNIKLANYGVWDINTREFTPNESTVEDTWIREHDNIQAFKAKGQRWNHLIIQEDWRVRLVYDGMGSSYRSTDYRFDGIVDNQIGNVSRLRTA